MQYLRQLAKFALLSTLPVCCLAGLPFATDVDLRAAFCSSVIRANLALLMQNDTEKKSAFEIETINKLKFRSNKLNGFVVARLIDLDPNQATQIFMAATSGADAAKRAYAIATSCMSSLIIPENMKANSEAIVRLIRLCQESKGAFDLGVEKCTDISFLPY